MVFDRRSRWCGPSLLAFELVVTRLFSVILWNHFAFLAISVALFGLGVAGMAVYLLPRLFRPERAVEHLRRCALLFAPALWTAVAVLCVLPIRMDFSRQMFGFLAVVFLTAALPFAVGGLSIALALTHWSRQVNRIYAFDLVGSALGCVLVIGLLGLLDGPSSALALGALPALAALVLRPSRVAVAVVVAVVIGTGVNARTHLVRVRMARSHEQAGVMYEGWNAFSRVTVSPAFPWRGWWVAPSNTEPGIPSLGIQIDADAYTPLLEYKGDPQAVRIVLSDITSIAYHLVPNAADVMVIGAGGGKDVLAALVSGTRHVRAVELNPIIARDIVSGRFREFTGDLYHDPRVELVVGEGRTALRHDPNRYDVIQLSMVDTSAASAAGAYALTENSLYTLEAAREYLQHLRPNGVLTATWVNFPNLEGGNRLAALYAEALRREGLEPVSSRLAVIGSAGLYVTVLARRTPFSPQEVDALRTLSTRMGLQPIYLPGDPLDAAADGSATTVVRTLVAGTNLDQFYESYRLDLRPVTDDRPFFFYQQRFRDAWWALTNWNVGILYGNGLFIIVKLMVLTAIAVVAFMGVPLLFARRAGLQALRGHGTFALYFLSLGVGFIVLEIALVQMFGYYLGHPLLGLGVSLASLLLFTGGGSSLGGRWSDADIEPRLRWALTALIAIGLVYCVLLPVVTSFTIAASLPIRIAVVVLLFAPLGLLLGLPFPSGLRLLAVTQGAVVPAQANVVPWMWAINAAATVFGSTMATMLVIHLGFARTLLIGTLIYGVALAAVPHASRSRRYDPTTTTL